MLVALAIALVIGWVILKLAVGVTSAAIHLLLAGAVLAAVAYFLRGGFRRGATSDVT